MGIKRPDQIGPSDWRAGVETVGQMYQRRWELIACCDDCQTRLIVDLRVPIAMLGPRFSLWNRRTRCRRLVYGGRCRGFVRFEFKAPGMTDYKPLAAADRG